METVESHDHLILSRDMPQKKKKKTSMLLNRGKFTQHCVERDAGSFEFRQHQTNLNKLFVNHCFF